MDVVSRRRLRVQLGLEVDELELVEVDDVPMRRFTITMKLDPSTPLRDYTEIARTENTEPETTPLRVTAESDEGMVD